jgi:hypothetical protein
MRTPEAPQKRRKSAEPDHFNVYGLQRMENRRFPGKIGTNARARQSAQ